MTSMITFTPGAIEIVLHGCGFAKYDEDEPRAPGFEVFKAAFGRDVIVELKGRDLIRYNPGEGPRALMDEYLAALDLAGYEVRSTSGWVVVAGVKG
jgi:hypothetical protein